MRSWTSDLRHSLRGLGRTPWFTSLAVITLALGIGANTALFSLVSAVLLRFLPFPEVERLVILEATHPRRGPTSIGPDDFRDWREQNTVFDAMAYTMPSQANFTGQSFPDFAGPERLTGTEVSEGFFELLGVQPLLGRWFRPEEQQPGRNRVLILSYRTWVRRFGARPDILGQSLTLDGHSYTVVGVMPEDFRFNEGHVPEYWIPLAHQASGRLVHQYRGYARLKPGVPVEAAQAQLSAIARRLEEAYPATNTGWGVRVTAFPDALKDRFGAPIAILFAVVAVVLLIACANVANFLLARAAGRTREIAIRRALGAGREHVVRLFLGESLMVSLAGGGLGLLLASWAVDLGARAAPEWMDLGSIVRVDRHVLTFSFVLSVVAGILTGLAPAWQALREDVNRDLKPGDACGTTGSSGGRLRGLLVISEVALATPLLILAGLLTRSFVSVLDVDLGFRTAGILTFRIELPPARYAGQQARVQFYDDLLHRVGRLPGVKAVGGADSVPMSGVHTGGRVEIEGRPMPLDGEQFNAGCRWVTPQYFQTLGIPLRRGRFFSEQDRENAEPVIVVNEAFARRFFAGEDAVGKRIRTAYDGRWRRIVGIVGDTRHSGPETPARPETFTPFAQQAPGRIFLAARTAIDPSALAGAIRREVRALDRDLPVSGVKTMEEALSDQVAMRRQLTRMTGSFGALALLLAALGIGGVVWYSVSRRTQEIGLRMALGARQGGVVWLILKRGIALSVTGLAIGFGLALGLTRLLGSLLYGINPNDPLVFTVMPVLLTLTMLAAAWLPARRAAAIDPMSALRHE